MNESTQAIVLKVGDRFYHKHNSKRITTAWSLAGAKLFLPSAEDKISEAESALIKKGYKPVRLVVGISLDKLNINDKSSKTTKSSKVFSQYNASDSVCYCNKLPDGEVAISSKALLKPYGDLGQTEC